MTDVVDHDAIRHLLGAYALDATEPAETALVEEHLSTCEACRTEADELREVAGLLGGDDVAPPAELWSKISAQLGSEPPAVVTTLRAARRSRPDRMFIRLAAAAVIVLIAGIVALAFTTVNQQGRIDRANDRLAQAAKVPSLADAADRAAAKPGARRIALKDAKGVAVATAVVQADGTAYLVPAASMTRLDRDHTYQLWGVAGKDAISLGVLGAQPGVTRLTVPEGVSALAITTEVASGVITSKNTPVASATLT